MQKIDEIVTSFMSDVSVKKFEQSNKQVFVWKEVVSSIKSNLVDSSQLVDHSRIIDLQNNTLIVETDHAGRSQLFQLYKKYILTGLNRKLPELKIKNLQIRIKNKQNPINYEENLIAQIDKNLEKTDKDENILKKEKIETPKEITDIIDRIKSIKW